MHIKCFSIQITKFYRTYLRFRIIFPGVSFSFNKNSCNHIYSSCWIQGTDKFKWVFLIFDIHYCRNCSDNKHYYCLHGKDGEMQTMETGTLRYKTFGDWIKLIVPEHTRGFFFHIPFFKISAQLKGTIDFFLKKSEWK